MNYALEVTGLSKDYGRQNKKKDSEAFALKNVSFALPEGYIMGFVGPNGAGKTTTIKTILKLKKQDDGKVSLFGKTNSDIGVVMDSPCFPDEWTLARVEKALSPFYGNWSHKKFSQYLVEFGLGVNKKVEELSRGMKVKLLIAIALSHDAKLLVLDEPTSGLDPVSRDEICELLTEFIQDGSKSVLFSTHITSDLEKIADYITVILGGEIRFSGTKDELMEKYQRVAGGINDISESHREHLIGTRFHGTGFEGLAETTNARKLPTSVLCEAASLEEIIVFLNREFKSEGGNEHA